jgi:hypothetical protein
LNQVPNPIATETSQPEPVWGPHPNYDDIARYEYGRRLWRLPEMRNRLLAHWLDERHPHRERFMEQRSLIEAVLASNADSETLDAQLRESGASLRTVAREIPPVFGSFWELTRQL